MDLSTTWWLLMGSLIVLELLTGTFYLLMLSLGAGASAIAAQAHLTPQSQMVLGALVGGLAVMVWHLYSKKHHFRVDSARNEDLHLDIGETVQVLAWDNNRETLVKHRGAQWIALLAPGQTSSLGPHRIVEIVGSRLILEKLEPHT